MVRPPAACSPGHTVQHSVIVTVVDAGQAGMQEGMLCLHWSLVPRYTCLTANVLPGNSRLTSTTTACFIATALPSHTMVTQKLVVLHQIYEVVYNKLYKVHMQNECLAITH